MNFDFINLPDDLRARAADAVAAAIKNGADQAEASLGESVSLEVGARRGALETMNINREQEFSITVYCRGGVGIANAGELSADAIADAVDKALTIARHSEPDKYAGLADLNLMTREVIDLDLYHPWAIDAATATEIARAGEAAALSAHPEISADKSEGAAVSSGASLEAYANSHGFCAAEKSSAHSFSCAALATRDGLMESDGWSETRRNADDLPTMESVGAKAGTLAGKRLGGGTIGDCRAPVLFQSPASHSLLGHFVGAASGGSLYRKTSWLLGKLGEAVWAPHISVLERPHILRGIRSAAFDDDGVAPRERRVVGDGEWRECFLSAYSARKLGMQTTANAGGHHNLQVVSGETARFDDLLRRMGTGLWVTDLMGQGANPITGDYSRAVAGFWVEGGEAVFPVSEVTVAGNLQTMLASVAAVGDDDAARGGVSCGSFLIPDMAIGGNR